MNTNADSGEIEKFSEIAHHWWDTESEFKPLHDINPLRLGWINQRAPLAGKQVVDVGCGGGILSESMAASGAHVTGIDLSEKALGVARMHLLESGYAVDYQHSSVEEFAQQHAAAFDIVTCMELLEHIPDPASAIAACAMLLKPGGNAFFSTLNRNPKSYLMAIIGAERVLKMLPPGTHDYAKFIKPSELARYCREAGLEVAELNGMSYNPFTRSYAFGANTDVNYVLHARRP